MQRRSILMMGTAEWNAPIATNQHYVAAELARENNVTFVESIGLRAPKLNAADLRRIGQRLLALVHKPCETTRPERPVPDGVNVISPIVLPLHNPVTWPINWLLLRASIARGTGALAPQFDAVWLYTPVEYGVHKWANTAVYHCVDLLGQVEGISSRMIESAERRILPAMSLVIATSRAVKQHLESMGGTNIMLAPNVADTERFGAWDESMPRLPQLVFGGALSEQKLDLDLIETLAHACRNEAEIVLIGPKAGSPEHLARLDKIFALPNVTYGGVMSLPQLAQAYQGASVGIMPYLVNSYTSGISPLKTYEFLAAGLPVVSVRLPGVPNLEPHVRQVDTHDAFINAVRSALLAGPAERASGRRAAAPHGWAERGQLLRKLTAELISVNSASLPGGGGGTRVG